MSFSTRDINYMQSALKVLENSRTQLMEIHDKTSDWNEKNMVFAYDLSPGTFQNQVHAIMTTVTKDANRIQQFCHDLNLLTQREEWVENLQIGLKALLAMIDDSDIKIYTFDNGIKKTCTSQQIRSQSFKFIQIGLQCWQCCSMAARRT